MAMARRPVSLCLCLYPFIFVPNYLGLVLIMCNCNFFKKWAIPGLFFFNFVFSIQLTVNVQNKFLPMTDTNLGPLDWMRPLYQLSHSHCPCNCNLRKSKLQQGVNYCLVLAFNWCLVFCIFHRNLRLALIFRPDLICPAINK